PAKAGASAWRCTNISLPPPCRGSVGVGGSNVCCARHRRTPTLALPRKEGGNKNERTPMQVQPHVCFEGRCEEAIEFYRTALGAEVTFLVRFKEMPGPQPPGAIPPGGENKVMHATFRVGGSTVL